MRVLKFGGTSVQDVGSIARVVEIVADQLKKNKRLIIVSSAMGGITNQLIDLAEKAERGQEVEEGFKQIEERHLAVIKHFIPAKDRNPVIMQIKLFLNELEELLLGVRAVKELSPKTRDSIVSYGELCSNFMLSGIFEREIAPAEFIDTRKLFVTDDRFGNARIQHRETEKNINLRFSELKAALVCVPGFIAADEKGQTTTLGRGGSDYTAAILGSVLGADEIQIWTDVDGFMTADPRIVKEAYSLTEITYTEAKELSYFGAKVIYPPTMVPAFAKRIPISIKNTFNTDFPGTKIYAEAKNKGDFVRGITSIKEVNLVNIQGSSLVGNTGFSGRLFSLLARKEINIVLITQASSEHSITFAIAPEDAEKAKKALEIEFEMELMAHKIDPPEIVEDLSIVAIVGEKMKRIVGISGRFFDTLGRNRINVVAIAQGSSEYNISTVIAKKDLTKAINAVHDEFFLRTLKKIAVYCVGTGNIGGTLLHQINAATKKLFDGQNIQLQVKGILNSRKMILADREISLDNWQETLDKKGGEADLVHFVKQIKELSSPHAIFVDNSASDQVVSHYEDLLKSGVSLVTCNKIGNSSSQAQYDRLRALAQENKAKFLYETNVGAGLPIIGTLKDLVNSGDQIVKIEAVLSGTLSYIFNNFQADKHFYEIVKEAQDQGYTEPDPRDDLSGLDFARKMLILARESGLKMELEAIQLEKLLPESCSRAKDVNDFYKELKKADAHFEKLKESAEKEGKRLRYIGVLQNEKAYIKLKAVGADHPFYNLSGSDNIIAFTTGRYESEHPLVIRGPGAGAEVTAGGVFADLMRIATR